MDWRNKSDNCTKAEFEAFRRELDALRNGDRSEEALIRTMVFEDKWNGVCLKCGRVIPNTKKFCPWCLKSRF